MFEWDEDKRLKNLAKHKLDFVAAGRLYDGRATITTVSAYAFEPRYLTTAQIEGKFYSLVWTGRDGRRRFISFRRARDEETRAYRQIYG